jgi:hypothetical protein
MSEAISSAAVGLRERLHERVDYVITEEAASVYDTLWRKTAGVLNGKIDPAYFRRVTWSTSRYAVLYHLLLGEPGREIGPHAMQWAWRMTLLHLQYVREVLNLSDVGFAGKVEKILSWVEMRIGQGTDPTSSAFIRELIQHFRRDLSNASEARQLIDLARKSAKSG